MSLDYDDEREFSDEFNEDESEVRTEWVMVAEAENKTLAEFAINGLKSYDIPAVLDNRPGVFGSAGLPLRSLTDGRLETFRIMVPAEFVDEAREIVTLFLGAHKEENDEEDEDEWD